MKLLYSFSGDFSIYPILRSEYNAHGKTQIVRHVNNIVTFFSSMLINCNDLRVQKEGAIQVQLICNVKYRVYECVIRCHCRTILVCRAEAFRNKEKHKFYRYACPIQGTRVRELLPLLYHMWSGGPIGTF